MAKKAVVHAPGRSPSEATRVLILYGPELMLQRQAIEALLAAIEAKHGPVEPRIFDGAAATVADVLDELRTQSLLASYRVVVVDDAATYAKNYRDALERYAQHPVEDATLVLRSVTWHPGRLDKLVETVGLVLKCEPVSPNEAVAWLDHRAQQRHRSAIQPQAATALVERLGTDLTRLDTELAKLAAMANDQPIDTAMVEALVGRSSDEQAWVVQEAVLTGMAHANGGGRAEMGLAISKAHELVEVAGQPEVLVMYWVADVFRKLYQASLLRRQGASLGYVGKALRLWGPRAELTWRALSRLPSEAAGHLFDRAVAADRRSKSGFGDTMENLEVFLARVPDELS